MIKGQYIFSVDGKEIARSNNLITKFGKRFLTSYIAGVASFASKDIAIGIASSSDYTSADTNSRLGFEFFRSQVTLGGIDVESDGLGGYTYSAIYKTTVPQDIVGTIKEIGLYPGLRTSLNDFDSKFLSTFENNLEWVDSVGSNPALATSENTRIGDFMMEVRFDAGNTTSSSKEYKFATGVLNISGYSVNDTVTLAFNRPDTNSSKIRVKFYSSLTDCYYGDFALTSLSTGNYIKEISMSSVFSNMSGSPDASNISHIGVELYRTSNSSNSTINLDGLRINDEDTFDPSYGLISRSILSTPIDKIAGRPVDIEYKLTIGF